MPLIDCLLCKTLWALGYNDKNKLLALQKPYVLGKYMNLLEDSNTILG